MENREEPRERERRREWRPKEPAGGGPDLPGGDAEPSNWPGETRERGMHPPEPEPLLPTDDEEPWEHHEQASASS